MLELSFEWSAIDQLVNEIYEIWCANQAEGGAIVTKGDSATH
ncbi:hypothetical protein MESS4_330168 [Mesorhizobium sp. STM 4661]|nr:hypothetical protein MESS4_330168 [Mesorhizobium sp. STM 4661]